MISIDLLEAELNAPTRSVGIYDTCARASNNNFARTRATGWDVVGCIYDTFIINPFVAQDIGFLSLTSIMNSEARFLSLRNSPKLKPS